MATTLRLAREQAERAFAQFLISKKEGSLVTPVDVPVLIRKGKLEENGTFKLDQEGDEIPLPSLVISCPRAVVHAAGHYVCDLHVLCLNSVDEEDARSRISDRFGLVANALPDIDADPTAHQAVFTFMNKPASGTDERIVKDFHLIGLVPTDDMGEETGTSWIDHLVFEVHCNPTSQV